MSDSNIRHIIAANIDAVPAGTCFVLSEGGGIEVKTPDDITFRPMLDPTERLIAIRKREAEYTKEKRQRLRQSSEEFAFPPERLQHDVVEIIEERDPEGWIVPHGKVSDTILRLLRNGFIDDDEAKAARRFQRDFRSAQLEAKVTANYEGIGLKRGDISDGAAERLTDARYNVNEAMQSMGGHNRPAACSVWHIIGRDISIKEFAERERFGRGRSLTLHAAQSTLRAALGCLVGHYELVDSAKRNENRFHREHQNSY